jgi:hypothetical protein
LLELVEFATVVVLAAVELSAVVTLVAVLLVVVFTAVVFLEALSEDFLVELVLFEEFADAFTVSLDLK